MSHSPNPNDQNDQNPDSSSRRSRSLSLPEFFLKEQALKHVILKMHHHHHSSRNQSSSNNNNNNNNHNNHSNHNRHLSLSPTPSPPSSPDPTTDLTDLVVDPPAPNPTSLLSDHLLNLIFSKLPVSQYSSNSLVCRRWLYLHGRLVQSLKLFDWSFLDSGRVFHRFPNLSDVDIVHACIRVPRNAAIIVTRKYFSVHLDSSLSRDRVVGEEDLLPSRVIDSGLKSLAESYPNLRRLVVIGASEDGLSSVAKECQLLQELEVIACGDLSLKGISGFMNLQIVKLIGFIDDSYFICSFCPPITISTSCFLFFQSPSMAEAIVTSLLEALVTGLLEKSGSLIAEGAWPELKSFLCLHKEVQKLGSTLSDIQAVLEEAEKRQVTEPTVKRWLDKLKEAAYDIDNVLDELEIAMIKSKIEEEEEEKSETTNTLSTKVWSCISCLSLFFVKLKELVHRRGIAHEIKKLNETLDEIAKEKDRYSFRSGSSSSTNIDIGKRPETISEVDVSDIIGRKKYSDDLVRNLLGEDSGENERNPYVISLVGMGGIGKTTLAQLAYNDDKVKSHFDIRMWVCVSEPFDISRVVRAIIQEIKHTPLDNDIQLQTLVKNIKDLIQEKRFFLVLDDVWTEDYERWEQLKLALNCGAQGSRILVTTRYERVTIMVNSDHTISLDALSEEDCQLIFSKIAFANKDESQREQLTDLGKELVKRCKGLPLAAKTLGSLMRNKSSKEDWRDILDSNLWKWESVQKGLLGPLLLSYYEQPSAIKSCFLYCALFPKDYLFSRNKLIYLWMSQGYLGVNPDIETENIGEEYFEILVMHSFFQDFKKDNDGDKVVKCKMHDIVHDFAQFMASKECFTIDGDKELGTNCKSARHLRLEFKGKTQFPMSMYNAKNVRTLFFTKLGKMNVFPLNLFQHLTCLRALTLKFYFFENLPNEVEKLIHLRLLDLSDNYQIKELPETMCNLCHLQTLNISGCDGIRKLPQGMRKLTKLRHLITNWQYYSYSLQPFPKGFGRLSSLRTLNIFIIGGIDDIDGCKLGELKDLNHLKGSLTIKGLENVTDVQEAENAQLKDKKHLRELRLLFDEEVKEIESVRNDEIVLKALEPHPNLEILEIDYCMSRVYPNWMKSLSNLKRLELRRWPNLEQLPPLGKLPFLEALTLWDAYSVKKVGIEFLGIKEANGKNGSTSSLVLFPNLKSLKFWDMKDWEEWDGMGGRREEEGENGVSVLVSIMPRLQSLSISQCPKLKALPNFLETTSLKELSVNFRIFNWMTLATLSGLKTLTLSLNNDVEHLPPLGKLLLLESLQIIYASRVKKVGVEFLGIEEESNNNNKIDDEKGSTSSSSSSSLVLFPNLKSLAFRSMIEWEEWDGIGGTMREEEAQESGVTITIMPRLQELEIGFCPKLKSLPDFLPTTPLKTLKIYYSTILRECCKAEIGDQWPKISHIPNIEIDYRYVRRDGRPMQN